VYYGLDIFFFPESYERFSSQSSLSCRGGSLPPFLPILFPLKAQGEIPQRTPDVDRLPSDGIGARSVFCFQAEKSPSFFHISGVSPLSSSSSVFCRASLVFFPQDDSCQKEGSSPSPFFLPNQKDPFRKLFPRPGPLIIRRWFTRFSPPPFFHVDLILNNSGPVLLLGMMVFFFLQDRRSFPPMDPPK